MHLTLLRPILLLPLLLLPILSFAVSTGPIQLSSQLHQPLKAEVELLSATAAELAAMSVSLASAQTFSRFGLTRSAALLDLRFQITGTQAGQRPRIQISSVKPITAPYLDLIVEIKWHDVQLLRHYTLLFDHTRATPDQPSTPPPTKPQSPPPPAADPQPGAKIYRIKVAEGNSLWRIARQYGALTGRSPAEISQMLWRQNREAFTNGDIKQLRVGADMTLNLESEPTAPPTKSAPLAPSPDKPVTPPPPPAAKPATPTPLPPPAKSTTAVAALPPAPTAPIPPPAAPPTKPAAHNANNEYGPVRAGETLWSIAGQLLNRQPGATRQQVMQQLHQENPTAFEQKGKVNTLRVGARLQLPPTFTAQPTPSVSEKTEPKVTEAKVETKPTPTPAPSTETKTAIADPKPAEPKPNNEVKAPTVTLVAPSVIDPAYNPTPTTDLKQASQSNLRKELVLALELSESLQKENQQLRQRIDEIQQQVDSIKQLLLLKKLETTATATAQNSTTALPAPTEPRLIPIETKNGLPANSEEGGSDFLFWMLTLILGGIALVLILLRLFEARREQQTRTMMQNLLSATPP